MIFFYNSLKMLRLFTLILCLGLTLASVPYKDCGKKEVTNVEITGCSGEPCVFVKGNKITLSVDFTANQDSDKAEFSLIASHGGVDIDMSTLIKDFDKNGCHSTTCPIKKGAKQSFKYDIVVPISVPDIEVDLKAQLKGNSDELFCGSIHSLIKS
ncbi:mite group 2 allergen Gly d 2.02-like [Oppia nitens]|uniref:mite group 2 allergen Gly d 2.02-like n=1 Tax=Oppia nitens TaxID=1686743 RepID=UPI0023D9FFC2|nr:mite group 2 allergen Gly d 2.02-like [Oppia nitens]